MSSELHLITGATGFVGSHIAERLVMRGNRVRAFVRPTSDTSFLLKLGVELIQGDLLDPDSIRSAIKGISTLYHCVARVSDWGPWHLSQEETVDTSRNIVQAASDEQVDRLVYVSSVAAYGHPRRAPDEFVTEDMPLGQNGWWWDHYSRAKKLAEEEIRRFSGAYTILRPSWIYGPRDRVSIPRIIPALRNQQVPILGSGNNFLNIIYISDVVAGILLAASNPLAAGQAYNLNDPGKITQIDMLNTLTDTLQLPRVNRHVPASLAMQAAFFQECWGRLLRRDRPPTLTRKAVELISRSTQFGIDKARQQLGWEPKVGIQEGIQQTLNWFLTDNDNGDHSAP